ncbi:MAG: hypothetical protein H3C47_05145 [Candidatus Cloacimonetes bacterium]|nr:hypothetical protein [Candidatus Cloacimonadota bacterium]
MASTSLRQFKGFRGLSLVEVLAATALMAMLLVPIFLMLQYSTKAIYRSQNDIMATSLAVSKIEELRSFPFHKLENILLGLHPEDGSRLDGEVPRNLLVGPFEMSPPRPDIVEMNFYRSGSTEFHRYTWLSYFPLANPDPNHKDFDRMKKRILVRVQIFWKDRLSRTVAVDQELSFESVIHDENYNPKPGFNRFFGEGS